MAERVHWNVGGMQGLADSQDGAHGRFNSILSDVKSSRARLLGNMWHGAGTDEYSGKQNKQEGNYEQLQSTFRQLIGATNNSIGNAHTAMGKVKGVWG